MTSRVTPVLTVCDVIPVYQDKDGSMDLGFMNGLGRVGKTAGSCTLDDKIVKET